VRVLVVDDEPDARDLISHILRRSGASVSAASSAQEAVAAMPQFHPHILVSDISMPGEDGYSLIRQVRSLHEAQGGRIPAVALTALARKEDRRSALLAGFQMHLAKPVEPNELTTAVANLVKAL
jgi:CheY-like chemotaxis protein